MLVFLTSCRDVDQEVSPKTAFVYLSAIQKYLQVNEVDVAFFKDSHNIHNTKAGMLNAHWVIMNRDVKGTERLPIFIGMIQDYDAYMRLCPPQYAVAQMDVHAVQLLGYTTLSRVSEHLLGLCLLNLNTC